MKLKCLRYSKLGKAGDIVEINGPNQCKELIQNGICEEFTESKAETKPAKEKKQAKGGKKPAVENLETK